MKKILILSARSGEEEDVAATNLGQALEFLSPGDLRLEVVDLLQSCYGRFEGLLGLGFQSALRNALRDLLRTLEPDVVIATGLLYGSFIEEIFQGGRKRDFTYLALVTETVIDASAWRRSAADYYAVSHDDAARELGAAGIPETQIKVFGYPVQLGSHREELKVQSQQGRTKILYLINTARKKAPKLIDRLLENLEWEITVVVEAGTDLAETVSEKAALVPGRLTIAAEGASLPQLLRENDLVISRVETGLMQEAIAARCPIIVPKINSRVEEANFALLRQANAGALAEKPRAVIDWLERALRDKGCLLALWRRNLEPLGRPNGTADLARFVLDQALHPVFLSTPELRALPAPRSYLGATRVKALRRLPKKLLLCDLHTHTTWSDGKLTIAEMVDFYGQRGFDCLCITDHLCDPKRLLGKLVNLTGMVIPPDETAAYFDAIEREKKRAWAKYDLLLMSGVEFNKDGYTAKTSTHLLGVDLKQPIDPSLDIRGLIMEIHAQGALAIASHPHEMKSSWGKDTLYLWENVDEYAPLIDAWEVANRDDIFNPVGLKKLPFIANSDFHKPKHIHSWKTLLYCEKEAEAIKHCIRINRDVSLTLYRDHRFGLEERPLPLAGLEQEGEPIEMEPPRIAAGNV